MFIMQCIGMSALLKIRCINYLEISNTANYSVKLVAGNTW